MSLQRRKLPVGIQNFDKIRTENCYYVDKTALLQKLIEEGSYYLLSRPRRFGKSLLIDTLKCLFEGREECFRGLAIHPQWDWQTRHPVVHLSFGGGVVQSREELDRRIDELLSVNAQRLGVDVTDQSVAGRFAGLLREAHAHTGQRVVVLVDEYDKPILDNLRHPERALEIRDGLRNVYSVIKDSDSDIRFVMLTGVSKFSKVSLFSGLNNLNDITLDRAYATICGYTDADLDAVFAPELPGLDREQIRRWYNGYRWGDAEVASVYNPFDVLLLFQKREFRSWWFESATPTFLVELLAERGVYTPQLGALETEAELLGRFDVEDIATEALLFQTGYLTIHRVQQPILGYWLYTLGYPNLEVESSLNQALLPALGLPRSSGRQRLQLFKALEATLTGDFVTLDKHFRALFASLPHDWYRNNPIARYEGHYASVFYSHLAALGLQLTVEEASNHGRVDLSLGFGGRRYLFEFKVIEQAPGGAALAQLKERDYAAQYRNTGQPIELIGVEFSSVERSIVAFAHETVQG